MKIAVVSAWWPTHDRPNASPFIEDHAAALRSVGQVERWAVQAGLRAQSEPLLDSYRIRVGVPWRGATRPAGYVALDLAGIAAARRRRPDAIVLQSFEAAGPVAVAAARAARCPFIYVEHWSAIAERHLDRHQRAVLRRVARAADVIASGSPNLTAGIAEVAGIDPNSIVALDNPLDATKFPASPGPRDGGARTIVQVADFRAVKGHDLLVDALAILKPELPALDLRFRLVGDGVERPRIEEAVARLGLGDWVTFTGSLRRDRVSAEMRRGHWTMLTSRSENAPISVAEALVTGRPVLAPALGAIPSMVGPMDGIVYPRTTAGLVDALRRVGRGDVALRSSDARSRDAVDRFAPGTIAARYAEFFRKAAVAA